MVCASNLHVRIRLRQTVLETFELHHLILLSENKRRQKILYIIERGFIFYPYVIGILFEYRTKSKPTR